MCVCVCVCYPCAVDEEVVDVCEVLLNGVTAVTLLIKPWRQGLAGRQIHRRPRRLVRVNPLKVLAVKRPLVVAVLLAVVLTVCVCV